MSLSLSKSSMADQRYIEVPLDLFATDNVLRCPPTVHLSLSPPSRLLRSRHRVRPPPPTPSSCLPGSMWCTGRLPTVVTRRAMDLDVRAGLELPDDVIEAVARANAARVEGTLLPEVRASQCPFHSKSGGVPPQQLQATTHHAGLAALSPRKISLLTQQRLVQEMKARLEKEDRRKREETMRNQPMYRKQTLPESITSREFVMSWLYHGTDPSTETHFPDIDRGKRSTTRSRKTQASNKKSFVSE